MALRQRIVSEIYDERNNSVELFGYDFMIDMNLKPWIIEINKSPSLSTNTVIIIYIR